jgi:hypothetical protein
MIEGQLLAIGSWLLANPGLAGESGVARRNFLASLGTTNFG